MSELLARLENVGKTYRRFEHQPFLLRNVLGRLTGQYTKPQEFWPLRDVSFDVRTGETIGLIGANGSGKSTLLRLMAGASFPSAGHIAVRGRVAPLLALGAGFQPDMTGRECVRVNAALLGMSEAEIEERVDPIIRWAELTEFLDTPVRYYSSGMWARLAFSVAVHTDSDLMLVDEVLAVGDEAFQRKCAERIGELQRTGTAIVLVSHSTETIRKICGRVLWLRDGLLVAQGEPGPILEEYKKSMA